MARWSSGRNPLLIATALLAISVWLLLPHPSLRGAAWNQILDTTAGIGSPAPAFPPPSAQTTWINSPPLTMRQLRGQVVMIDFWEYTCINCIRTFPQTKLWYQRYKPYGFVVIGVHDPEFPFAAPVDNVRQAGARFGLPYPIVVDDGRFIWRAYSNSVWPNRFLIDAKGIIRYNVSGEGHDREFEAEIQKLLIAAHPGLKFPAGIALAPARDDFAPDCGSTTPELYVGNWQGEGAVQSRPGYHDGKTEVYAQPKALGDGRVGLSGAWESEHDGMIFRGNAASGSLAVTYHAREIYAVMNLAPGAPATARIYLRQDGHPLNPSEAGQDVATDDQGRTYVDVTGPRMYYLVKNADVASHKLEMLPTADGVMVSSFTFGNNCQTGFEHR